MFMSISGSAAPSRPTSTCAGASCGGDCGSEGCDLGGDAMIVKRRRGQYG